MNSTFPHFLLVLTEALDIASGNIDLSAERWPLLAGIGADEARMGCAQLITHIRALTNAKRLKPVALNLARMDDAACAKLVAASPILREWIHIQQNVMTFSDKISVQKAEQMFELVRSRYKFIVLSDPARPAKKNKINERA